MAERRPLVFVSGRSRELAVGDTVSFALLSGRPTTLAGYGITDAAPIAHVGSGGAAHANVSASAAGFMAAADKSKLDGIASGATANTGTVTSVAVADATGITWSGSPITSSGTLTPTLSANLQAWSGIATSTKEPAIAAGTTAQYWRGDKTWQALDKAAVGLSNADNTSDANKPVSTATQNALNAKHPSLGGQQFVELGSALTGNRDVYIDFHADDTNTDFGFRIIRYGGVNGGCDLVNTGSGPFNLYGSGAFRWNNSTVWHAGNFDPALKANSANPNLTGLVQMPGAYWSVPNPNTMNAAYNINALADMWINYRGYLDGFTQFRDFRIGDGKGALIASFLGSDKSLNVDGTVTAKGLVIGSSGAYAPGAIYSDAAWGMIFRAKSTAPTQAHFLWTDAAGGNLIAIDNTGVLRTGGPAGNAYWHAGNFDPSSKVNTVGATLTGGLGFIGGAALDVNPGGTRILVRSHTGAVGGNATIDAVNADNSAFDVLRFRGSGITFAEYTIWHAGNFDPASKQNNLGFSPVQQGGGAGQGSNKIYLGWDGGALKLQVDSTDLGYFAMRQDLGAHVYTQSADPGGVPDGSLWVW
jgi:hypothetical protein